MLENLFKKYFLFLTLLILFTILFLIIPDFLVFHDNRKNRIAGKAD